LAEPGPVTDTLAAEDSVGPGATATPPAVPADGDTLPPDETAPLDTAGDDSAGSGTEGAAGDDMLTDPRSDTTDGDVDTVSTGGDETITLAPDETLPGDETPPREAETVAAPDADADNATRTPPPGPPPVPPAPAKERRGGFVPLLLGGIVAAGIGYGAAYMGWLPTTGDDDTQAAIAQALDNQSAALADLRSQVADLAEAAPPEVDLSPVLDEVAGLSDRIDAAAADISALSERVTVLEDRPVFTGNVEEDTAAAAEAAAEMEAELAAQREAAEARAAELEAAAAEAEAEARAAEEEAAAAVARAEAEAALNALRVDFQTGAPFAEALSTVSEAAEVPDSLSAVADTGVPTLEALQERFPPLARDALPVALQQTAGDGMAERLTAFVRGQIGGRAIEPRAGDDPDAVLSRVGAAVEAGDLQAALDEISALPDGAQDVLAPWVADVEARVAAAEGLDALSDALSGTGN
jgi:hypothetical protein